MPPVQDALSHPGEPKSSTRLECETSCAKLKEPVLLTAASSNILSSTARLLRNVIDRRAIDDEAWLSVTFIKRHRFFYGGPIAWLVTHLLTQRFKRVFYALKPHTPVVRNSLPVYFFENNRENNSFKYIQNCTYGYEENKISMNWALSPSPDADIITSVLCPSFWWNKITPPPSSTVDKIESALFASCWIKWKSSFPVLIRNKPLFQVEASTLYHICVTLWWSPNTAVAYNAMTD